ncbi:MAG TPA: tripartite tricarboxylate transporter substrate-binding protein [Burkholderiales bacterium]|nr:tripartite tricarboxylate transporter substrate-binding protein [Burkholderiales bacterium]
MIAVLRLFLLLCPLLALAQSFPSRPIALVVPYAPGGGVDTVARALGQELAATLGGSVIVENRPGASSIIGSQYVAKAEPSGHVLLVNVGTHYAMPYLAANVPYDPVKDFTPITIVGKAPQVLAVHPSVPANDVAQFIDYVKKNPGKVSFATSGKGTSQHLAGELLNVMAKLDMTHVPYKGGGAAINDLAGGQVPAALLIMSNLLPLSRAGKVRMLAVVESTRSKALPELPTIGETISGFAVPDTWIGILGPAALPAAVTTRLDAAITQVAASATARSRLEAAGFEPFVVQAPEFAKLGPANAAAYKKITAEAGIKPE